jgi:hypothetical protein
VRGLNLLNLKRLRETEGAEESFKLAEIIK